MQMVLDLLDIGDKNAWEIIKKVIGCYYGSDDSDTFYDIALDDIYKLLLLNIDKINENALEHIKLLSYNLALELVIKFDKIEDIEWIANKIISNKATHLYEKLINFLKYHNKNNDALENINMDIISPTNKLSKDIKEIQQITSYFPFDYKLWKMHSRVYAIEFEGDRLHIIFNNFTYSTKIDNEGNIEYISHKNNSVKEGTLILIGNTDNTKYHIYPISKIIYYGYNNHYHRYEPYNSGEKYICYIIENVERGKISSGGISIYEGTYIYV